MEITNKESKKVNGGFEGLRDKSNVLEILITTDNHMGFREKDAITGQDSFIAFEECLEIARKKNVDFVLLGGDLFHDQRPSQKAYLTASQIFNRNVFNTRHQDCTQKANGRQSTGETGHFENEVKQHKFKTHEFKEANYLNPLLNIRLPVFSIHGNHDDPVGLELLSTLDQVSTNHYINYFGKVTNIEKIEVKPVLFEKGNTKVALYGIGHMRDERLNLAFEQKSIKFKRPSQDKDQWFNILVIHQNKYKGMFLGASQRQSIQDKQIPSFIDLVVWGHEHESITEVWQCEETGVYFLQPGSTVATSMIEMEAKQKHCFMLKVMEKQFTVKPIPLKSTRPLIFRYLELNQSGIDPRRTQLVEKYIQKQIDEMLDEAYQRIENEEGRNQLKPQIRLKIEHGQGGYQVVKSRMLNAYFVDKVANPGDCLQFYKKQGFAGSTKGPGGRNNKKPSSIDGKDFRESLGCDGQQLYEDEEEFRSLNEHYGNFKTNRHFELKSMIIKHIQNTEDERNQPILNKSNAQKSKSASSSTAPCFSIDPVQFIKTVEKSTENDSIAMVGNFFEDVYGDKLKQARKLVISQQQRENKMEAFLKTSFEDSIAIEDRVKSLITSFNVATIAEETKDDKEMSEKPRERSKSAEEFSNAGDEEEEDELGQIFKEKPNQGKKVPPPKKFEMIQYQPNDMKKSSAKEVKMRNQAIDGMLKKAPKSKAAKQETPKRAARDQEDISDSDSSDFPVQQQHHQQHFKPKEQPVKGRVPPSCDSPPSSGGEGNEESPLQNLISDLLNDDVSSIIIKDGQQLYKERMERQKQQQNLNKNSKKRPDRPICAEAQDENHHFEDKHPQDLGQKRLKLGGIAARNNDPWKDTSEKETNKSRGLKEILNKSIRTSQKKSDHLMLNSSFEESLPDHRQNQADVSNPFDPELFRQNPLENPIVEQRHMRPAAAGKQSQQSSQRQMPQFNFSQKNQRKKGTKK